MKQNNRTMPAFWQVKNFVKCGLASGRWRSGDLMPSEMELVAQFGVSRMTVNRALRELVAEGLIDRVQGVGTFAARMSRISTTLVIRDMHEHVRSLGHRYRLECRLAAIEPVPADIAKRLGLEEGDPAFHSIVVHFSDDMPLQYEDRFVNPMAAPDYLTVDFQITTPTQYLLEVAPTWEAFYTVDARLPHKGEARELQIVRTDPCLVVKRWTVSRGRPVTFASLVHPGSRYNLEGSLER